MLQREILYSQRVELKVGVFIVVHVIQNLTGLDKIEENLPFLTFLFTLEYVLGYDPIYTGFLVPVSVSVRYAVFLLNKFPAIFLMKFVNALNVASYQGCARLVWKLLKGMKL